MTMTVAVALRRKEVRDQIATCLRCDLPGRVAHAPVPFRGPTPSRVMVLGEAPGATENDTGVPFVGPSGTLMATLCAEVGLDFNAWFIANTVCCYPAGPPGRRAVEACRVNLRPQIEVADPEWILTLGAVALGTLWPRGKVTRHHGHPFEGWGGPAIGRLVFPTYHPAAALRSRQTMSDLRFDLGLFADILRGNLDWRTIGIRMR